MRRSGVLASLVLTPFMLVPCLFSQEQKEPPSKLVGGVPGVAFEGPDKLAAAVSIHNTGKGGFQNVKVSKISLPKGRLAAELKLPVDLAAIRAGDMPLSSPRLNKVHSFRERPMN